MKIKIKPEANKIIHTLQKNGFEAYAVGGCVRNAVMGIEAKDWDICTDATPDRMKQIFSGYKTVDFGLKHGTLAVISGGEKFEVTTYRIDGTYSDNRHPENVTFTDDLTIDLSRRDFTCNAMAYNDEDGLADPFGGVKDIKRGLLRCVGNPDNRFNEDALRILRGLRFASVYGFAPERKTSEAIKRNAYLLNRIAGERIHTELDRILCGNNAEAVLREYREVFAVVVPGLSETFDFPQRTPHHRYDVWEHIVHSVGKIEPDAVLRMTMLLHDIGKPRACTVDRYGANHFKGHPVISTEMARNILSRLKYSNEFSSECLLLIEYHDVRYSGSQKQIKRLLNKIGEREMRRLFKVQRADTLAQSDYLRREKLGSIETARAQLDEIIANEKCFSLKQLEIKGGDLIGMGIPKGERIGTILNTLLDEVIDEKIPNKKDVLIKRAKEIGAEAKSDALSG